MVQHSRSQKTTRKICQGRETSGTIRIGIKTRTHGAISQYPNHWTPRKGQHPHPHLPTLLVARDEYWIENYVTRCAHCQQNKIHTTKKKTPLYHTLSNPSTCPFNIVALDLITQLPKANRHNAILMVVDQGSSRAAIFIPCNTMITGEGVALLYLKHLFPWFRVPFKVISDRDPHFTLHFTQALTTKLSIGQNISTAFHPQTDGLTEHKNQWVE